MRFACLTLAAVLAAGPFAWASQTDFKTAHDAGDWAGCVYQPGFDPYEITLTRAKHGFIVNYPGICFGTQRLALGNSADAAELIHSDETGVCVPMIMVDYSLQGDDLRLTYHGAITASARLHPLTPQSPSVTCQSQALTS